MLSEGADHEDVSLLIHFYVCSVFSFSFFSFSLFYAIFIQLIKFR